MAIKVGSLYVSLTAQTGAFIKGLGKAVEQVEKTVKQVKKASGDIAAFGTGIAAGVGAAMAVAAKYDPNIAMGLDRLKNNFTALGLEVAQMALPALHEFTDGVSKVLGVVQSLSPETRKTIGTMLEWGLGVVAVAMAMQKLMSGVEGLMGLGSIFGKIALTLGPIVLALGAIWIASAFVRDALGTDFKQIGDWAADLWKSFKDLATPVFKWVADAVNQMTSWFSNAFDNIKKEVLDWATTFLNGIDAIFKYFGKDSTGVTDIVRDLAKWADHLTTKNGLAQFFDDGVAAGKRAFEMLKGDAADFADFLKSVLPKSGEAGSLDGLYGETPTAYGASQGARPGSFYRMPNENQLTKQREGTVSTNLVKSFEFNEKKNRINPVSSAGGLSAWTNAKNQNEAAAQKAFEAMQSLMGKFASKLGKLGDVISSATAGFEMGGVWGAIIAVLTDLLSSSSQFTDVIKLVDQGIQMLADTFGTVLQPAVAASAAANNLLQNFLSILQPILEVFADAFMDSAALFQGVAVLLQVFGPVLKVVMQVVALITKALTDFVELLHRGLYESIRFAAITIVGSAKALASAWNWVIDAIANLLRGIGLDSWADGVQKAKIGMGGLDAALNTLWSTTFDVATAQAEAAAEIQKGTGDVKKFSESLTNVPSGWKVQAARFAASNAVGGGGGVSGNLQSSRQGLTSGEGETQRIELTMNVSGNIVGVDDFTEEMMNAIREAVRRRDGGRAAKVKAAGF